MSQNKPKSEIPCFECDDGVLETVVEEYTGTLASGEQFTFPGVKMEKCNVCGDTVIGAEGNRKIDQYIAKITEAVSRG